MPRRKVLLAGAALILAARLVDAAAPYLLNAQQADFRSRPEYIRDHFAHIETLPFDGIVVTTTTGSVLMKGAGRSHAAMTREFAPLHGLPFDRMKQNFAWVNVDRPGDFFDDWTATIENFRTLARVLRENRIVGIFLDNEEYLRPLFNYPEDCDHPSKSLTEYQEQARLRGREIGRAITSEYPAIVFMVLHGPYSSFSETPHEVHRGQTQWENEELRGPFSVGIMEGMDSRARFVDGGAVYAYRTAEDFFVSADYRKVQLGLEATNCPFISLDLRPVWSQKLSVAFGVYNQPFAEVAMDPAIMRTTLAAALGASDEYVWLYSENMNWNAPGEISQKWTDAIIGARSAAATPAVSPDAFVTIASPAIRSTFVNPASIVVAAHASRADGNVTKIEFLDGDSPLGEDLSPPFSFEWINPPLGNHTLIARGTDDRGVVTSSSEVPIQVVPSFSANINFQTEAVTPPLGYFADFGEIYGPRESGLTYGWNASHQQNTRAGGGSTDLRLATLCQFQSDGYWEIAVPSGNYNVTVGIGDGLYPSTYTINVEGLNYWLEQSLAPGEFVTTTRSVTVTDGQLTLDQGNAPFEATRINYILIAAADSPPRAPDGLTAVADFEAVDLAWKDNSSDELGFALERSTNSNFTPSLQVATLGVDITSYHDRSVVAGATYYYRLRAYNTLGDSPFSDVITTTVRLPDSDADTIPDALELPPFVIGIDDRQVDTDGDGSSNLAEYVAGTNAAEASSRPAFTQLIQSPTPAGDTVVTLCFPTVVDREYFIDFNAALTSDIWTLVPDSIVDGSGELECRSDVVKVPRRFYRLRVSR